MYIGDSSRYHPFGDEPHDLHLDYVWVNLEMFEFCTSEAQLSPMIFVDLHVADNLWYSSVDILYPE